MNPWGVGLIFLLGSYAGAQTVRPVHIEGRQAQELISLLVSGNEDVRQMIKDGGATTLTIHDLQIEKESTYKYDSDSPYYKLDVVHAWGTVENENKKSTFGDATALRTLFTNLNLNEDGAMSGTYIEVKQLRCTIQPSLAFDTPARFACDLEQSH